MAGFWFLVSVVLLIIILSGRKKDNSEDSYAQGYWNGYRAFGGMVDDLIKQKRANEESLRALINVGETGGITQEAVNVPQSQVVSDPEAQFIADTYDNVDATDDIEVADMLDDTLEELQVPPRRQSASVVASAPRVVEMTAEQKAARSLRNLNIILYTASFLLVAAGALFVASSSTPFVKLLSVMIIIAVFYMAGFVIYSKSVRLRPAALAFLGTGLALIPFAGLALQQFTNLSTAQSWMVTSLIGLVAYCLVAVRLKSLLVSYLTMAFVLSLVGSMSAAATSAIVWPFVAIIGVSLLASVVAYAKPKWLPAVFNQPVERSGQIVTPVVMVASLVVFDKLRLSGYEILFTVATLHYAVAWLQTRGILYETTVRVLSYIVFALVAWDIWNGSIAVVAFTMILLMTFQHIYSLYMVTKPNRSTVEQAWLLIVFALQLLLVLFCLNHPLSAAFSTIALTVIGATSLAAALRLRKVSYGLIGFGISLILPFVVARGLVTPALPWGLITVCFITASIAALWLYARWRHRSVALRYFMTAAYITYLFFAVWTAWFERSAGFMVVVYAVTAAIVLIASYAARNPMSQLVVVPFVLLATSSLGLVLQIAQPWHTMFVCVIGAIILWAMTIIHGHFQQLYRQTMMLASGQIVFFLLFVAVMFGNTMATTITVSLLLGAAFISLGLRWYYRARASHLNTIFSLSYMTYFVAAFLGAALLSVSWWAIIAGLGIVLFTLASYVERRPLMQIVSSVLVIVTLSLVSSLSGVPWQWRPLFVFGIAAALFYSAALIHHVLGQARRQFMMIATAQLAVFMGLFAGWTGDRSAMIISFAILLAWAFGSLVARWRLRDTSAQYGNLFLLSYPLYYVGATMLLMPIGILWAWVVAMGAGAVLFFAASYVEKQLGLQVLASVMVTVALGFVALLIKLPGEWAPLFVFGGSAAIFYGMTLLHRAFRQFQRQFAMTVMAQVALFGIVFTGLTGHYDATLAAFSLLLTAAIGSLMLRWWYRDTASSYSQIFLVSYPVYYFGALLLLAPLASTWSCMVAASFGVALASLASYAERRLWLQGVAAFLTMMTLQLIASLVGVPYYWTALFVFGGGAVLFYLVALLHFLSAQASRQLLMVTFAQATLLLVVFTGYKDQYLPTFIAFVVLLVWSLMSLALRVRFSGRSRDYAQLFRISYPLYYLAALLLMPPLDTIWSVVALAVGVSISWVASYVERSPSLSIVGDVLLAVTLIFFWDMMNFGAEWKPIVLASILAAIFYASHWLLRQLGDTWRATAQLWATWLVLTTVIIFQFWDESKALAVAGMIIALAGTLAIHGWQTKRPGLVEGAVYVATFGMQRVAELSLPELNVVFYAHWWAIILVCVALSRQTYKRERFIVAMGLVTLSSGVFALTHGGNYQLLFLIEHLALLVAGALLSKSWAIWWGISASALAILYFLRTYTFLLLAFLGLLLIGIVVWRLMRGNNTSNR
jgi:hypothetical protein